jgi:hypothetical protein
MSEFTQELLEKLNVHIFTFYSRNVSYIRIKNCEIVISHFEVNHQTMTVG